MGAFLGIVFIIAFIRNQMKKMGKIKNIIISANIILVFFLNVSIILNVVQIYEKITVLHILIFSILIILSDINLVFFHFNIRENGIVFGNKKIFWEDIQRIKKTNHYIEVIKKNDKRFFKDIFNFDSSFLEKECKKRNIEIEFPHRK